MSVEFKIFNFLSELGCCKACCLRYVCSKFNNMADVEDYIQKEGLLKSDEIVEESQKKKFKANPCIVCLGLLQEHSINEILSSPDLLRVKEYDCERFTCSISMPACIYLREHSIRLLLEEKFPEYFIEDKEDIQLNKAWKVIIKDRLGAFINKTFENSAVCDFSVNICMDYENNLEELLVLKNIQPKLFEERQTQHRKFNGGLFSRKVVLDVVEKTPARLFQMNIKAPPETPLKGVTCKSVQCKHDPIFFAGRYCKYSRELSQTPWIVDGVKTMETSVQEIIFEQLNKTFGIKEDDIKFGSSGREDCDVRCLGRGRPFYVEIADPVKTKYTFDDFRNLEDNINKSTAVKVRDMQLVQRVDLTSIKQGEELKTKEYNALCLTKIPVSEDMINKINNYGSFVVKQKTPIRVLHRRPLAVRDKEIHVMKAVQVPGKENMFELNVVTQAGTYVKEFVHGDFGRTKPSIGDIIGSEVDIIALDVNAINLDWPEPINYNKDIE